MIDNKLSYDILNSLADDGENILHIEKQLKYYNISFDRKKIKECLNRLLENSLVYIVYPPNKNNDCFVKLSYEDEKVEDYWFEMTEKGCELWDKTEYKFY